MVLGMEQELVVQEVLEEELVEMEVLHQEVVAQHHNQVKQEIQVITDTDIQADQIHTVWVDGKLLVVAEELVEEIIRGDGEFPGGCGWHPVHHWN